MDRISQLKEYLKSTPSDSFLQHALALEYVKTGDDVGAKKLFEVVLQNDPKYTGSYYHLAKTLERLGEVSGAKEVYEAGMSIAKAAGDGHAFNELQAAWEDLCDQ